MAAALVGGALLSSVFNVLLERLASREVVDFFKSSRKLDLRLRKKLELTMITVCGLLDDAEEKQIGRPAVMRWLDELKDAAHHADDLLDEIAYECLRKELEAGGGGSSQVRKFLSSFNHVLKGRKRKINERLQEIVEKLEYLVQQKGILGLVEKNNVINVNNPSTSRLPTTSLVDESGVYGRNDDKKKLVELLMSHVPSVDTCLDVIPIVGLGGIGKTTLAQLVYNDGRVQIWFDLKVWLCVSETFDVRKLTEDVLKSVSEVNSCGDMTDDQLHRKLEEVVMHKKVLLVLDDVWSAGAAHWDFLLKPFKSVAEGSKAIVTTRDEKMASIKSLTRMELQKLKEDDSWLLFVNHAFGRDTTSLHDPELVGIGREIVKKCDGLPLAVKALGGLLSCNRDVEEWEKVWKSSIWDVLDEQILPALKLSYHYLPSQLKQCFAYTAIFPKDYKIDREVLLRLWMAEGLLIHTRENKEMEEIGEEYIRDLVSRSLLQQSDDNSRFLTMHDLVNDLAGFVSRDFCIRLETSDDDISSGVAATERTRYLSFVGRASAESGLLEEQSQKAKFLRVLSSIPAATIHFFGMELQDLVSLKCLQVLRLPNYVYRMDLPDSIGEFKHLRYLDLSHWRVRSLPEVVCTLYHLQTLIMRDCSELAQLPDALGNLKYLRYLNLSWTSIQRLPSTMHRMSNLCHLHINRVALREMPPQVSKLTKLVTLTDFFIGEQTNSSIAELGPLENLGGKLCIWNLENVGDVSHAKKANLRSKKYIVKLELRWGYFGDDSTCELEREILELLHPNTKLQDLGIYEYNGKTFPEWVGNPCFSNLASLTLSNCRHCSHLPALGQLEFLKNLEIDGFSSVEKVGSEFYGNCNLNKKPFASLEKLTFSRMPRLQELVSPVHNDECGAFPLLQELRVKYCPEVRKILPNYHLPCLVIFESVELQKLVAPMPRSPVMNVISFGSNVHLTKLPSGRYRLSVHQLIDSTFESLLKGMEQVVHPDSVSTLEEIQLDRCHELRCFPLELFQSLRSLHIVSCQHLESFCEHAGPLHALTSLLSLSIRHCPDIASFPEGGLPAPNLRELIIDDCLRLEELPESMHSLLPSLLVLKVRKCPEVASFPGGGLPSNLQKLKIDQCTKLIAARMQWDLQMLSSLSSFSIRSLHGDDVESFPEETLFPPSLTSLRIHGLRKLKSLDYKGFQHLTNLRKLKIIGCDELQSLPQEGLPSSLKSLDIWVCPSVEKRCQRQKGEDWPKIAHIPDIRIRSIEEFDYDDIISGII